MLLRLVIPLSILSIIVIVTNTLVCLLVYKVKSMRNYTNGFVVSLAISDILTGVSFLIQYNAELHEWSKAALNVLYAIVLFVGAANLCAVTYDRYLAILYPFSYTETISKVFKILVPAIWIFSIIVACIPLTWEGNTKLLNTKIYICLVLAICITLPYILIVYANYKIFRLVRQCVRRERELSISSNSMKAGMKHNGARKVSSEAKVARVFAIASLMFVLSYFPTLFYTAAAAFGHVDVVPNLLLDFSPFCVVFGSLVNPILYSFMKPDFRRALKKILSGQRAYLNSRRSQRSSMPSIGETNSTPFVPNKSKKKCRMDDDDNDNVFYEGDEPDESKV
ncbi:hypothetical protein ACROYT_G006960 [Oculina patagonica]